MSVIQFGSVFRHNEREFVYLGADDEMIYAARILDQADSKTVNDLYERKVNTAKITKVKFHALFCFVMLSTDEFKGRMAHFKDTGSNEFESAFDVMGRLNETDLADIKATILEEDSAVPLGLKDIIHSLDQ